jgi:pyruvyltransferase
MTPIKLFHWRPGTNGKVNLGDEISPLIVEAISGRAVEFAPIEKCELLAIGSLLTIPIHQKVFPNRQEPMHVWGTGLIVPLTVAGRANYICSAVRGPLTRYLVECSSDVPVGDPGILASRVFPKKQAKDYSFGIIPHISQLKEPFVAELKNKTPRSVIIDVTSKDILNSIDLISRCEYVASTSLHGLIIADSYKIPNFWLKTDDIHPGKSWKFYDYFSSVGRVEYDPWVIPKTFDLSELLIQVPTTAYFNKMEILQDRLQSAFPTDL